MIIASDRLRAIPVQQMYRPSPRDDPYPQGPGGAMRRTYLQDPGFSEITGLRTRHDRLQQVQSSLSAAGDSILISLITKQGD